MPYVSLSEEVKEALDKHSAVLALESTIIAHGMPYPQNLETALALEQICKDEGVTPATIAIMDGKLKVGLSREELELLAQSPDAIKCSTRDIPFILSSKKIGATTVAATMKIAEKAGIKIFATGGIGGVHRGAENTMDISADLEELARTNVAVVSAGAKSILDLGLTLEYLETKAVPVIGFKTEYFPSFYTSTSPFKVKNNMDDVEKIAEVLHTKWSLGLSGGVLIANPIAKEAEMEQGEIQVAIDQAIKETKEKSIIGKDITPYLLRRIKELTQSKSLDSNIALVRGNVRLGAQLAKAYA